MLDKTVDQIDKTIRRTEFIEGDSFGDFRIERELGRGSMGVVYLATQKSLRRLVAIKVLLPSSAVKPKSIVRFEREVMAASAVDHEHIVPVYDANQIDGIYFFVMRFVDGCSLADPRHRLAFERLSRLDRDKQFAWMFAKVADAIGEAHRIGIVHRDIKPSNLLLDRNEKIWISDFGLARVGLSSDLTASGDLIGTLRYMSPEQASGRIDQIDSSSDVYSLGASIYEVVTGVRIFDEDEGLTLLRKVQSEEPRSVRRVDSAIHRDLATIIERAICPDKATRYATAEELSADLKRFASGLPIHARAVTFTERVNRWATKRASGILLVLMLAITCLLAAIAHNRRLADEQQRTDNAFRLAHKNYREARDAVDRLGAAFATRLAPILGAREIRRDLLMETLSYYERFVADVQNDANISTDVAITRLEIARVLVSLESPEVADAAYAKAIDALQEIAQPSSCELWARAINERAILRSDAGDHLSALKLLRSINASDSDSQLGWFSKALTHNHAALIHFRVGQTAQALHEIRVALGYVNQHADDSANASDRVVLASVMNNLSAILSESGNYTEATQIADRATRVLSTSESDDVPKVHSAIAFSNLATVFGRAGNDVEAIKTFRYSIRMFEDLIDQSPTDPRTCCQFVATLNNFAITLAASDRFREAIAVCQRAQKLIQPMVRDHADHSAVLRSAASVQKNLATLFQEVGDLRQAQRAFDEAERYLSKASVDHFADQSEKQTLSNLFSLQTALSDKNDTDENSLSTIGRAATRTSKATSFPDVPSSDNSP
ncbi:tetratricopeptide repeat-containing serine/threonine protein kinase [Stieleria sp. JC731]|uniref:serine/threonine-protein kinase n=1 Tax=Pirellulaceae TaxID=2691357 RepID=UPI001E4F9A5A|nr:serine/threonine-protein kinase [Stieleria sp. JC731]MCC9600310.1 tetratricopeptide repeat-containing serine/threonine protein kinase [Stieleria sp. JC731]